METTYIIVGIICALLLAFVFLRPAPPAPPAACVPKCTGLKCGDDGCGGTCGTCTSGQSCTNGVCVSPPPGGCTSNSDCTAGWTCTNGTCWAPSNQGACTADSDCDPGYYCTSGFCSGSDPCAGKQCGNILNADGSVLKNCGTCSSGQNCSDSNQCYIPNTPPPTPVMSMPTYFYFNCLKASSKNIITWSMDYNSSTFIDSDMQFYLRVVYYDDDGSENLYFNDQIAATGGTPVAGVVTHQNADDLTLDTVNHDTHTCFLSAVSSSTSAQSAEVQFVINSTCASSCKNSNARVGRIYLN